MLAVLALMVSGLAFRGCQDGATALAAESVEHMDSLFFALAEQADSIDALGFTLWENAAVTDTVEYPIILNAATSEQLQLLPRIGPALATRILSLRQQRSAFKSVEELLDVPGIGPKTMERLRPLILADPPPDPVPPDSTRKSSVPPPE